MKELLVILVPVIATVLGWIFNSRQERKRKELEEIRKNNAVLYERIVKFFTDSIFNKKSSNKKNLQQDVDEFIYSTIPRLMVWGGDSVVKAFGQLRIYDIENSKEDPNYSEGMIDCLHNLIVAIRQELGHNSKDLKPHLRKLYLNY